MYYSDYLGITIRMAYIQGKTQLGLFEEPESVEGRISILNLLFLFITSYVSSFFSHYFCSLKPVVQQTGMSEEAEVALGIKSESIPLLSQMKSISPSDCSKY